MHANKELAYLFCLYATLPTTSQLAVRGDGFFDPFRADHYKDQQIIDVYSEPFLKAHKSAMEQAIPNFYLEDQGQYISILRDNITAAFNGDITAQQALQITAVQWDDVTEKIGRHNQIQQVAVSETAIPLNRWNTVEAGSMHINMLTFADQPELIGVCGCVLIFLPNAPFHSDNIAFSCLVYRFCW